MSLRLGVGHLHLQQFTARDVRALYVVRNHPSVRRHLPTPDPIPYRSHVAWTREHLGERSDLLLFVVRWKGSPVGFSLLKRVGDGVVEIGVMFREADRWPLQVSQATALTLYCAFELLGVSRMVSYAVAGHERALALNRGFGGRIVPSDRPGKILLEMGRQEALENPSYRRLLARMRGRLTVEGAGTPPPWERS